MKTTALALALLSLTTFTTLAPAAEKIGVSVSDAPTLNATFTITNTTNFDIVYYVRWGNGAWDRTKIQPGETYTHSIPIRNGRYATPEIKFDNTADDGRVTNTVHTLKGYSVGYNGYGASPAYLTVPKKYVFEKIGNTRRLDLYHTN